MAGFHWSERSTKAADLLAQGELAYVEIAESVGVTRDTLYVWRQDPEFMARVREIRAGLADQTYDRGVALRFARVRSLNDRWNRLRRVIEARADDPRMEVAPGGSTGLMVRRVKGLGSGDNFTTVEEFEVDTGLLAELRAIEKQAAQELGQWVEAHKVAVEEEGVDPEAAAAALAAVRKARDGRQPQNDPQHPADDA